MLGRSSLVATTLKAGIAIAVLSIVAANWLAGGLDRPGLSQLAAGATAEPATTGSLRDRAQAARLDPCVAPRKP
ncbi:MAG TPA: hypothetical protein VEA41_00170 [Salinarimonas sp.]|jgi:hypothetical protein|nr:hypothetical protein [Salinarimonas sp.]